MTSSVSKPEKRADSLLGHCLARAMISSAGGWDEAVKQFEAGTMKINAWLGVKLTPKASRVATFIVLWSVAMLEESRDEYSITEYQRYWNEGERQAYRLQKEFRELWPEFDNPNELAREVVRHLDRKITKRDAASLPLKLQVTA